MPIYEYGCRSCGRRVDVIHGISDSGPGTCDVCGGVMAKLLSPPAIVFKGSGWAKKERAAASSRAEVGDDKTPATAEPASADGKVRDKDGAATTDSKSPAPQKASGASSKPGAGRDPTRSGDAG